MAANRGAFQYDDYEFEAKLGPRELRPMTLIRNGRYLYEGEWLRDTEIQEGKCVILTLDKKNPNIAFSLNEGYMRNGKMNGKGRHLGIDGACYEG